MNSQLPINTLLRQLTSEKRVFIQLHGWKLCLDYTAAEGLAISTSVYKAENFVPQSVREAVLTHPFQAVSHLPTAVSLDEFSHSITLHYHGSVQDIRQETIPYLLEEFTWMAEQWWIYLDDHDRRDLIHVRVK